MKIMNEKLLQCVNHSINFVKVLKNRSLCKLCVLIVVGIYLLNGTCFCAPIRLNDGYFTGKDYVYKETGTKDGFQRIIIANNIEYSSYENSQFVRFIDDDAYMTVNSGPFGKFNFSVLRDVGEIPKDYVIDVYIDGNVVATYEDFNLTPNQLYQYSIDCGMYKSIRLQLSTKRGNPTLGKNSASVYIINATFE